MADVSKRMRVFLAEQQAFLQTVQASDTFTSTNSSKTFYYFSNSNADFVFVSVHISDYDSVLSHFDYTMHSYSFVFTF